MQRLPLIDTHTGGEPTRVLLADEVFKAAEALQNGSAVWKSIASAKGADAIRTQLRDQADFVRRGLVNEPRGSDFMVGAWVAPSIDAAHIASVVFFNNVGYLGMCGHGLIGVVEALRYQGRISPGRHSIDTPAGDVAITLHDDHSVTFDNVPSYRHATDVSVELPGDSISVIGDIAYGGNWFFLVDVPEIELGSSAQWLDHCIAIRDALRAQGITGKDGADIDHVELGVRLPDDPDRPGSFGGRNFVLCPGGQYDRSPCGTGTSAKVACLAADNKLRPGQTWTQESVIGSRFQASYRDDSGDRVIVSVRGRAFVTAETIGVLDPEDPFCHGIVTNPISKVGV